MPRIYIRNSSISAETNEVKIGPYANGSCDERLEHQGDFELRSGERVLIAEVDESVEVYWKNIYEYRWTHTTVYRNQDDYTLRAETTHESNQRVDVCDSQLSKDVAKQQVPPVFLERDPIRTSSLRMVDGLANWRYVDIFGNIYSKGREHGFACYLPTFNIEERADGRHYEVIAVKRDVGFDSVDSTKDFRDYGADKQCGVTFCWLACPPVDYFFRIVQDHHASERVIGAIPAFRFQRNGEFPRIVFLEVFGASVAHAVFKSTDIGDPDPTTVKPEDLIRSIVEKGKSYGHIVAAYPDFHNVFDPRPGVGRVWGVTVFYNGSADLTWLPEREIG